MKLGKNIRTAATLELSSKTFLVQLAQQTGVSVAPPKNATKMLHFHPHNTTVIHKLHDAYCEAKESFVNWYLPKGETDPTLIQFSNDAWSYLSGHNFQNPQLLVCKKSHVNPWSAIT